MRRFAIVCLLAALSVAAAPRLKPERIIGDLRGISIGNRDVAVTDDGTIYLLMTCNRVAVFSAAGEYLESRPVNLQGRSQDAGISTVGNSVFLDNLARDFPWLADPVRRGEAPGRFADPSDAELDAAGRIWVADSGNGRLQVFSPDDTRTPLAVYPIPAGPAALAVRGDAVAVLCRDRRIRLYRIVGDGLELVAEGDARADRDGIALTPDGAVLLASTGHPPQDRLVRFIMEDGELVEELVIAPPWWDLWPDFFPDHVPIARGPEGKLYFAATDRDAVLCLDPTTDEISVRIEGVRQPRAVALDREGNLFVTVRGPRILRFAPGMTTAAEGTPFPPKPLFVNPNVPLWSLLPFPDGDMLTRVIEDGWRKGWPALTMKRVTPAGEATTVLDFGSLYAKRVRFPPWECFTGLARLPDGDIAFSVHAMMAVYRVTPHGDIIWEASPYPDGGADKVELAQVRDVAVDSQGRIWAVDAGSHRVVCLSPEGKLLLSFGQYGDVDEGHGLTFDTPTGIAVTTIDGQEYLYVGDAGNQRLVKYRIIE